jgi:hypothetical protein
MPDPFEVLLARQDQICTRRQALGSRTGAEIDGCLGRRWQVILPGVYATFTGEITQRHKQRAALLHAGDGSMLTDLTGLRLHRIPYLPADPVTRVLVRDDVQRASRDSIVIRRTTRLPPPVFLDGFPVAPAHRALCDFLLRYPDHRVALAVAAAAVQLGRVSVSQLIDEARLGPARGRPRLCRVINDLGAGVRSAPENDFRQLVLASRVLPEPLWNCLLRLPDGREISPDALFTDAGLVHETNGRKYHSGDEAFDDMQERHDAMTAAGLTVLHNPPHRIRSESGVVIAQVEECHTRDGGRGLPPGVVILRPGPPGTLRPL